VDRILTVLRAAAEPTRLRLLALLAEAELTVSELTQVLGQSQPRVSRHLKLMGEAELLERHQEGSWAFFRLVSEGPAARLARELVAALPDDDGILQRDQARLQEIRRARAEAASAYFRASAPEWHRIRSFHIDEGEVESALVRALQPDGQGGLLDIGTGTGRMLELFGPQISRGLGVDASREMLALARAHLDKAGLRHCSVRHADMYTLPIADRTYELVLIHQVLHYAERPDQATAEAARVLAPGGSLAIVDFAPHELEELRQDHAHRRLGFTDAEIQGWLKAAGLTPEAPIHLPGRPLTVGIWIGRRPAEPQALRRSRSTPANDPARALLGGSR
jgi:SAM-dependent methyltransferase/DNA-binding MarR family transcriptional regulator